MIKDLLVTHQTLIAQVLGWLNMGKFMVKDMIHKIMEDRMYSYTMHRPKLLIANKVII